MLKNYSTLKSNITSIAIGGFDGMHLAHQELFKKLSKNGAIVAVETGYANLTPNNNREKYTDFPIFYYPLSDIKHLHPNEFIDLLKNEYPNLNNIVIGFDFKFGTNASGSIDDMKRLFDGKIDVIDEFIYDNIPVHSKIIRDFISSGQIQQANRLLGRYYSISGVSLKGQGLGKKQFVPTINIKCDDFLPPMSGIYSSFTTIKQKKYLSVTFVGNRISTDNKFSIETHLIDEKLDGISSDIKIDIDFVEKIRDNKKYDNLEELKKQILLDIEIVKTKNNIQ